eukprot:TRINITY_DN3186_c0_g2_i1.p2 TRINITY_DN3186_c0_g2~~TRINITY_DN3186_c0_g2_i1.p2  ORF type:complete len:172 (+),score=45.44 TRINITY_DN3186_c0_g2_i1:325-840(+)
MFAGALLFDGDMSAWDVSQVTSMSYMFCRASAFNGNVSAWNTLQVKSMAGMFSKSPFNGDVSAWNVSQVTTMANMFRVAGSFNSDLSAWDVSKVADMSGMFLGVSLPTATYDAIMNAWSALSLQSSVPFHGGGSRFSVSGKAARDALFTMHGWVITDGCGGSGDMIVACGP